MVVLKLAGFDTYIANILDYYGVCDRVTDRSTGCRFCCLSDAQFGCCIFSFYCRCCCYLCRIISADCCRIRFDGVHDLAGIDVILGHCVSVLEGCLFTRCQCEGLR